MGLPKGINGAGDRGGALSLQRARIEATDNEQQAALAVSVAHRRRLATQGARTAGPVVSVVAEPIVVLQSDFVDVVSSTLKTNLVVVVRDADGKMRLYADASLGGGGGNSYFPSGWA